jgi:hypothetical protein
MSYDAAAASSAIAAAWIAASAAIVAAVLTLSGVLWQARATAREAWKREFRQHAAVILRVVGIRRSSDDFDAAFRAKHEAYYAIRLLIAERKQDCGGGFLPELEAMWGAQNSPEALEAFRSRFTVAVADVLRQSSWWSRCRWWQLPPPIKDWLDRQPHFPN